MWFLLSLGAVAFLAPGRFPFGVPEPEVDGFRAGYGREKVRVLRSNEYWV